MKDEFDKWFHTYFLHKTASCLDRDILRWAKPILEVGFKLQARDGKLEFKGSKLYLEMAKEFARIIESGSVATLSSSEDEFISELQTKIESLNHEL